MDEKIFSMLETIITKVGNLEDGFSGLKADVSGLKADVSGLKTDVSGLKKDVAGLKKDVAHLQTQVTDTRERIILMENDNKLQFGGLFDGYQQLYEITGDIRTEVVRLSAKQDKHDFQIFRLHSEKRTG